MNTGDPLTEAACWNAAWRMVTSGALSGADLAGLVTRRLAGVAAACPRSGSRSCSSGPSPPPTSTPPIPNGAGRVPRWPPRAWPGRAPRRRGSPAQRALAAGFAASAHSGDQLAQARAWLDGGPRPDGLDLDGDLRGRLLRTLAARGLATDEDLDALAAADPVGGERNRAACLAARPDAAAKAAAWELALGGRGPAD